MTPVTVALITYNRVSFIERSLPLLIQELQAVDELLVIDNNSTDGTRAFVCRDAHSAVRYLFVDRQGLNICRNIALQEARHNLVAFIDDDAVPGPGWLNEFRTAAIDDLANTTAIFAGRTLLEFPSLPPRALASRYSFLLGAKDYGNHRRRLVAGESPGGGNMMVNRLIIHRYGPFDEDLDRKGACLLSNGETALCDKLHRAAVPMEYVPTSVIHHWAGTERTRLKWLVRRMFWQGVSDGIMALKSNTFLHRAARRVAGGLLKTPLFILRDASYPPRSGVTVALELARTAGLVVAPILKSQ